MAEKGGVTKCSCKQYLDLVLDTFFELLKEGCIIRFHNVFKVELITVVGKTSTDFVNGGRLFIPPHKKIKFMWYKNLRKAINEDE